MVIQPRVTAKSIEGGNETEDSAANHYLFKGGVEDLGITEGEIGGYFNYPLVIAASMVEDHIEIQLSYEKTVLSVTEVEAIGHQIDHVFQQLCNGSATTVNDISLVNDWEMDLISCLYDLLFRLHW